jgi:hypothetical protein
MHGMEKFITSFTSACVEPYPDRWIQATAPQLSMKIRFYYPPIYDHVSFQRIYQTSKPRGIFPNTFFTVRSCCKAGGPLLVGSARFLIHTAPESTLHVWRPSPASATRGRAMFWWQGTYVFAVKMCTVDRVMDELVKLTNVWQLIIYLRIWDDCPYFLAMFT